MRSQSITPEERFWAKVEKTETCWLWTGAPQWQGYGLFQFAGRLQMAHRVALVLAIGRPLTKAEKGLHTCDTPACVRNDDVGAYEVNDVVYPRYGHLFIADQLANMRDKYAKGRQGAVAPKNPAAGNRNGAHTHPERIRRGAEHGMYGREGKRGEDNARARVTEAAARTMFVRYSNGETLQHIADSHGVTKQAVWNVLHGKTWRHLGLAPVS
jgi:hypothetical protein